MSNLETKIEYLPSIGPKTGAKFVKLGLVTLYDLLFDFPRRYEDYTTITKISELSALIADNWQNQSTYTIKGQVIGIENKTTRRRGFTVTEAVIADESGTIKAVWFNQPFLAKMYKSGFAIILNGKVSYDRFSASLVMESPNRAETPKIVPIYSETAGLTSYFIFKLIKKGLLFLDEVEEPLPAEILEKYKLCSFQEAIRQIHEPKDLKELAAAKRRLAFDELFMISLRAHLAKEELQAFVAPKIVFDQTKLDSEIAKLPFELTLDQQKAIKQVGSDMAESVPMNRLINGDVGSGKTVVAAMAAFMTKESGLRTLLMAPTGILAVQHFETLSKLFGEGVGIFTANRKEVKESDWLIVGTHALIQKSADFDNLGLVIVDEQHRFGVKQRQALLKVGSSQAIKLKEDKSENVKINNSNEAIKQSQNEKMKPHFLSMTATPIPRTLHLALFGDLDLTLIKEKPANRKEIKTRFVEPENRDKAYEFIREHLRHGRQAFVICPLIEENTDKKEDLFEEDRKSVVKEYEKLKEKIFPEFQIEMLHGKLKPAEKDEIMARFSENKSQVLVSTSVVEVGVDVPNASVMMIEDAERFGLAQIHQFRGRVGRAEHQSFCFLFSSSKSEKALTRLRALEETADGFKLAEIDLETRGPGSILGTEQSGMLDLKMASLSDHFLIEEAAEAAKKLAPNINDHPALLEKMRQYSAGQHLE
jgi:ATP-dependent DNA helicase RecG